MKLSFALLSAVGLAFAGCATPNAPTIRPASIEVSSEVVAYYAIGSRKHASACFLPPGHYTAVLETKTWVLYSFEGALVRKAWLQSKRDERVRPGGLVLDKFKNEWDIYTVGPTSDLAEDGMPDIGILFGSKTEIGYVNVHGKLGRTDGSRITRIESRWFGEGRFFGIPKNVESIRLEGEIPLQNPANQRVEATSRTRPEI